MAAGWQRCSTRPPGSPPAPAGLFASPEFLLDVERKSIGIGRLAELAGYNDYRRACGFPRMRSFADVSSNPEVQSRLKQVYRDVDSIELYPGLFAEDIQEFGALPTLMATMVSVDAFSQALTNPLLAETVFNERTFSAAGMEVIGGTTRL